MLLGVVSQILPKMICQRIFGSHFVFENICQCGRFAFEHWKLEITPLTKPHDENTFTVLGDNGARIDHFVIDGVTERLSKSFVNDLKCSACIVTFEMFDVLKNKSSWLVIFEDVRNLKKK